MSGPTDTEWWKDVAKLEETIEREGPESPRIEWLKWKLIRARAAADDEVSERSACNGTSGPMDPAVERVARALAALDDHPGHEALLQSLRATLTAHDHWKKRAKTFERRVSDMEGRESVAWESHLAALERERAKTKLYRSRCPVEASDVEAAGVTYARADAWCTEHEFVPGSGPVFTGGLGWTISGCTSIMVGHMHPRIRADVHEHLDIACFITAASLVGHGPAFDILAAMAALTQEAAP